VTLFVSSILSFNECFFTKQVLALFSEGVLLSNLLSLLLVLGLNIGLLFSSVFAVSLDAHLEESSLMPIDDLHIEISAYQVFLSWSPPLVDVDGNGPVTVDGYYVLRVEPCTDEVFEVISFVTDPALTIDHNFSTSDGAFYQVVAVGGGPGLPADYAYLGGLIEVPAGDFFMGQQGVAMPVHAVQLTHAFLIAKTEVSNKMYIAALQWAYDNGHVLASSTSVNAHGLRLVDLADPECEITFDEGLFAIRRAPNADNWGFDEATTYVSGLHPVKELTWYGAACYCDWLTMMEGLTPFYNGDWSSSESHNPYEHIGYRLPTEAEWEYVARFDDGRTYPWGEQTPNASIANCYGVRGWTCPIEMTYEGVSALGCMHMAGNVLEWCNDYFDNYEAGPQVDPYGPEFGSQRVVRGGDWYITWDNLAGAYRYDEFANGSYSSYGFRIMRSAP
jgi:formylglycine-generating enzyme required for sulfatase activity